MRALRWKARAALLYSLGGWTTLGALMYYSSKDGDAGGGSENESDPQAKQAPRTEVFTRDTLGFHVTTVITYKETHPPLTRLLRRLVSFFDPTDDPPSDN
ncbi:small integral membrane protein 26 [Pogoniulus pusillus]|uniref:small integral membrane protein 26 n=1 Tax=Pogoniulus pusillus TaxID=488313 RepID=UPI0030B9300A